MSEIEVAAPEGEFVDDTPPTVEVLQARVAELEAGLAEAGQTMTAFKALVRTEAMRMAEQHGLCGVVEQTLHKVGIDMVRRRVELTWTYQKKAAYEVPEELLTLVNAEQFIHWATTGRMPRGRTARDFRSVRTLTVDEAPVGAADMVVSAPADQRMIASPIGVAPPPNHIAAYASNDGRVLHYIPINDRSIETSGGVYRDLTNCTATCGTYGHWQTRSQRAENPPRACERCAQNTRYLR